MKHGDKTKGKASKASGKKASQSGKSTGKAAPSKSKSVPEKVSAKTSTKAAGKPNAGKSTLLNRVMGEKLAIVSAKPQSTRDRVVGIHSAGDVQMIIYDTPGLLNPRYALQRSMRAAALEALDHDPVVDDLVVAVDGRLEGPHHPGQRLDGHLHAGAEAARGSEQDLVDGEVKVGVIGVAALVLVIMAGIKANEGQLYRYPLSASFVK